MSLFLFKSHEEDLLLRCYRSIEEQKKKKTQRRKKSKRGKNCVCKRRQSGNIILVFAQLKLLINDTVEMGYFIQAATFKLAIRCTTALFKKFIDHKL